MIEKLDRLAKNAAQRAYSPYSGIRVGAAVADEAGRVFTGCNIENASYGLTLCAERVAIATAVAAGATSIAALSVAIHDDGADVERFVPCGACLQFLAEFAEPATRVSVCDVGEFTFGELLTNPFVVT
ncbi:MAG: cytidine deaminase [Gammaproteobacteria bacterium]|nr:cytidine deaminase [Gammaproteobacteria bacterium]